MRRPVLRTSPPTECPTEGGWSTIASHHETRDDALHGRTAASPRLSNRDHDSSTHPVWRPRQAGTWAASTHPPGRSGTAHRARSHGGLRGVGRDAAAWGSRSKPRVPVRPSPSHTPPGCQPPTAASARAGRWSTAARSPAWSACSTLGQATCAGRRVGGGPRARSLRWPGPVAADSRPGTCHSTRPGARAAFGRPWQGQGKHQAGAPPAQARHRARIGHAPATGEATSVHMAAGNDSEPDSQPDSDPHHTAPPPPRRILTRGRAALALTSAYGRGIVPPSVLSF